MPRASSYRKNREKYLQQQRERRKKQKMNVLKMLDELDRLQKQLDRENFESVELRRLIKRQIREDPNDSEKIEGASPW